jgi:transmembrane sensor
LMALPEADAEAIAWVIRLTSGDVSDADRNAFELWRSRSPDHDVAFSEARKLWVGLGAVLPAPVLPYGAAVSPIDARVRAPRARSRAGSMVLLAASIVLLIAVGVRSMGSLLHDHVTAQGQRELVTLADGSRVQLGSNSAIDVDFDGNVRRVRLVRGEAYFDVVHDARQPFLVDAGDGSVRDIGTAFSVRLEDDSIVVVVERGSVEVTGSAAPVVLAPSQRVRYGKGRTARVEPANVVDELAWTSGRLILEDRSLREVVDELNRYSTRSVVLFGSEIGNRRVNAVVDVDHVDAWLDALQESQGVTVTRLPGYVFLF